MTVDAGAVVLVAPVVEVPGSPVVVGAADVVVVAGGVVATVVVASPPSQATRPRASTKIKNTRRTISPSP